MKKIGFLLGFLLSVLCAFFSLTGCKSVTGNVIPETGPSMEAVYDGMGVQKISKKFDDENNNYPERDLKVIGHAIPQNKQNKIISSTRDYSDQQNTLAIPTFKKLPNPELKLYVYPHFAGNEEIPIPGYFTVFNAYEKTHYALPSETMN